MDHIPTVLFLQFFLNVFNEVLALIETKADQIIDLTASTRSGSLQLDWLR